MPGTEQLGSVGVEVPPVSLSSSSSSPLPLVVELTVRLSEERELQSTTSRAVKRSAILVSLVELGVQLNLSWVEPTVTA